MPHLPLKEDKAEMDNVYTPLIKLYMAQNTAVRFSLMSFPIGK